MKKFINFNNYSIIKRDINNLNKKINLNNNILNNVNKKLILHKNSINNIENTTSMLIHKNNNILNECYKINSNQKLLLMDYYKKWCYNNDNDKKINDNDDHKIIKILLLANAIQFTIIIINFFI